MSAQHTPGVIRYDYDPGYCGELIASNGTTIATFPPVDEADARRLVACWNACEGISTETLELVPRFTEAGIKTVQSVEAQRAELLAALRVVQSQCESMAGADWRKWEELASPEEFERWVKSRAAHMAEQARAAIAKVEGGAA